MKPGDAFTSQILYQLSLSKSKSTQQISSPIKFVASIANISSFSFTSCLYTLHPHEKFALKSQSFHFLSIEAITLQPTKNILKS